MKHQIGGFPENLKHHAKKSHNSLKTPSLKSEQKKQNLQPIFLKTGLQFSENRILEISENGKCDILNKQQQTKKNTFW